MATVPPHGETPLTRVPTLDELASEPGKAATLPRQTALALLGRCHVAEGALLARVVATRDIGVEKTATAEDRLVDIREASAMLSISTDSLYRKKFPFTVRIDGSVLFSVQGIQKYIRQHMER